jgi:tripartite-type tricarboxylate transporter receptor subunit TctC
VGSLQQLAAEWLAVEAGIKMQGIAYRGTGPAVQELMGGRLDLVVTSLGDFSGQAKAGELRVLTMIDDVGSPQCPNAPQASSVLPVSLPRTTSGNIDGEVRREAAAR